MATTNFQFESEMSAPVVNWMTEQGLHVEAEFPSGAGVCDLVGCSFYKSRVAIRISQRQRAPLGNQVSNLVYWNLPDSSESVQGRTVEGVVSKLGHALSVDEVTRALDQLKRGNHVCMTKSGSFQRTNGWFPLHRKLLVVELKLNRVQDVMWQAQKNLAFATHSYIALPLLISERVYARHRDYLRESGIGLLSVLPTGCEEKIRAKSNRNWDHAAASYAVERFWRRYRDKQ